VVGGELYTGGGIKKRGIRRKMTKKEEIFSLSVNG